MDNYAIKIKDLSKDFTIYKKNGQKFRGVLFGSQAGTVKHAITDVSLEIAKGENIAIVGNVGSGRSTLAKLIAGIEFPTKGEVISDGRISCMIDLRLGFDGELTGKENIKIKGAMMGWSKREIEERIDGIIEYSEMEDVMDHPLRSYAQGMGARLGFSVLTAVRPEILIIDNPLSAGDRLFREKMIKTLEEYAADENITIVLVSNDISLIGRLCNRGIVLEEGKMEFDGEALEAVKFYREHFRTTVKSVEKNEGEMYSQAAEFDDDFDLEF